MREFVKTIKLMLLVTLSITKSHDFQLEKQNTTNASEEVLYNNTHFNLLQLEIILQSRLKVEFGRSTCKNPEMVPLAHGPWEIRGKKQVTHLQYIRLQSKKIKLMDGKFLKKTFWHFLHSCSPQTVLCPLVFSRLHQYHILNSLILQKGKE